MSGFFKLKVYNSGAPKTTLESVLNVMRKPSFATEDTYTFTEYLPTTSTGSTLTFSPTSIRAEYLAINEIVHMRVNIIGTTGGVANPFINFTLPFTSDVKNTTTQLIPCYIEDGAGSNIGFFIIQSGNSYAQVRKVASANWTLGTSRAFGCNFFLS